MQLGNQKKKRTVIITQVKKSEETLFVSVSGGFVLPGLTAAGAAHKLWFLSLSAQFL